MIWIFLKEIKVPGLCINRCMHPSLLIIQPGLTKTYIKPPGATTHTYKLDNVGCSDSPYLKSVSSSIHPHNVSEPTSGAVNLKRTSHIRFRRRHHHRPADPSSGKRSALCLPVRPPVDATTAPNGTTSLRANCRARHDRCQYTATPWHQVPPADTV